MLEFHECWRRTLFNSFAAAVAVGEEGLQVFFADSHSPPSPADAMARELSRIQQSVNGGDRTVQSLGNIGDFEHGLSPRREAEDFATLAGNVLPNGKRQSGLSSEFGDGGEAKKLSDRFAAEFFAQ
jgi:hypothetical protein